MFTTLQAHSTCYLTLYLKEGNESNEPHLAMLCVSLINNLDRLNVDYIRIRKDKRLAPASLNV